MTEKEIFYTIALNFKVFSICSENDVDILKGFYKDKNKLRECIQKMIMCNDGKMKSVTKVEIFCLLIEFCFLNKISSIEICALFSIFWDTLRLSFNRYTNQEIFNIFKDKLIKHSMDRPPYQIGVFNKSTIEKISVFFIENVYKRHYFLKYMLSKNKNIDIINRQLFDVKLPEVIPLDIGIEIIPRNAKILKLYTENKKPKTDLEHKIETILDFHRDILDKNLESKFTQQDSVFNKKLEELVKKKK